MNLYEATIPVFTKLLGNVDRWIGKAKAYAEQKKFDGNVLVQARLAPDQLPFARQVQMACDNIKFTVARLTATDPPSHPDTEQTLDELQARCRTVVAYLEGFSKDAFTGSGERAISLGHWQGKSMRGGDYLDHYALPNIHFHLTTAYSILRHNGVDVGKKDYLGELPFKS